MCPGYNPARRGLTEQDYRQAGDPMHERDRRPWIRQRIQESQPEKEEQIVNRAARDHSAHSEQLMVADSAPYTGTYSDQYLSPIPGRRTASCAFLQQISSKRNIETQTFE